MQHLRLIGFVAGHTVELQGLRTTLLGFLCLAIAGWGTIGPHWEQATRTTQSAYWLVLLAVAWRCDDWLVEYYRKRMGRVIALHPYRRYAVLLAIALAYLVAAIIDLRAPGPVALTAVLLAAVQWHIGLFSGDEYRRHYLVGAVILVCPGT